MNELKSAIERAWDDRSLLNQDEFRSAIKESIDLLDKGMIRVAKKANGEWIVNEWIKKAVLLYFQIQPMEILEAGFLKFYDKIPLKKNHQEAGVRVVPHGIA